ncbi:Uncharacterized protein TCM_019734 [Theobroma cacao]|uniref:Uncharacterized protein n=1 Tax=Theobroma cacao TaxID=3641 RepID=A0A061EJ97_THECC|nr:Uncharacterized protein TCM_019734 [Theobroma cacao]
MVVQKNNRRTTMQKAKPAEQMEKPRPTANLGSRFVVLDSEDMEQDEETAKGKKQVPKESKIAFSSGSFKLTQQSNLEISDSVVQRNPSLQPLQIQNSKIDISPESGGDKNERGAGVNGAAREKLTEPMEDDNPIPQGAYENSLSMELESNEVVAM